jgi:hypothetical protein
MFGDPIKRVIQVLQMNLFGEVDDSIIFTFNPLAEDDERKVAEINKLQIDADSALISNGIITPEEARKRLIDDPDSGYNSLTEEKEEMPEEMEPFEEEEDVRKNDTQRGVRNQIPQRNATANKGNAQGRIVGSTNPPK